MALDNIHKLIKVTITVLLGESLFEKKCFGGTFKIGLTFGLLYGQR